MKRNYIVLVWMVVISFVFNLIWENLQMPLYAGYIETSFFGIKCLLASMGDVIIFLSIYILIAMKNRKFLWFLNYSKMNYIILFVLGILVAVIVEKFALASGRWEYAYNMPIIPIVNVGLTPVLQMFTLSVATIGIIKLLYKRKII